MTTWCLWGHTDSRFLACVAVLFAVGEVRRPRLESFLNQAAPRVSNNFHLFDLQAIHQSGNVFFLLRLSSCVCTPAACSQADVDVLRNDAEWLEGAK